MTLDQAFTAIGAPADEPPTEAIQVLLDHWDAAASRCRALLDDYIAGRDLSEATERALYPILHIFGETMDQAAFPAICALAADPERAGLILGDAAMDTLPQILVSCFDGDAAPLRALIEAPAGDPVIREGALMAMAYLAQTKRIPRADMHAFLTTLHDALPAEPGLILWLGWVRAVALLGFRALSGRAAAVFARGLISRDLGRVDDFQSELRMALQDPASLDGFSEYGIGPLGSAIAALTEADDGDGPPLEAPVTNPLRDIGRNDPCPCGSGKKFKKCCLV